MRREEVQVTEGGRSGRREGAQNRSHNTKESGIRLEEEDQMGRDMYYSIQIRGKSGMARRDEANIQGARAAEEEAAQRRSMR